MNRTYSPARDPLDRESPGPHFTDVVELLDFLRVNMPRISPEQQRAVTAWSEGVDLDAFAHAEGVAAKTVRYRINTGLAKLRELAGQPGGKQ